MSELEEADAKEPANKVLRHGAWEIRPGAVCAACETEKQGRRGETG